jgi:hypothetical protein
MYVFLFPSYIADEDQILGRGFFSTVIKGTLRGETVAVKTVEPGAEILFLKGLLAELDIIGDLGLHENIVKLLGSNLPTFSLSSVSWGHWIIS